MSAEDRANGEADLRTLQPVLDGIQDDFAAGIESVSAGLTDPNWHIIQVLPDGQRNLSPEGVSAVVRNPDGDTYRVSHETIEEAGAERFRLSREQPGLGDDSVQLTCRVDDDGNWRWFEYRAPGVAPDASGLSNARFDSDYDEIDPVVEEGCDTVVDLVERAVQQAKNDGHL